MIRWLLPLTLSWLTVASSCPVNETLTTLCKCDNSFSGILLNCTSVDDDASGTLRVLRENQAQLGLIQQLDFQNGSLTKLTDNMFDGLFVKKLDLTNNLIETVGSGAFRGLENVLQTLNLGKNKLKKLPKGALANLVALNQLDLSDNEIGDLVDEGDALANLPKLTDLNLANNRICNLHKDIFENVKNSLQTLNLGGNCFSKIPAAAVRGFKQLLALHFHNNKIKQLEPLQFMNLPFLNLINLANNQIVEIHRQSFLNVPNLRFMYLSENNISSLEANEFRTFENLELLDLTKNRIRSVPVNSFANMPKLAQLYMGENYISTVEAGAFANSSLVILLMSNNEMTTLNADMFNGLTYLQQFSLKSNKISGFTANTFYQMPSLVVLDLSDNQLVVLPPASFLAQLNMFLLDLSHNKLITVPYNAFNQRIVTVLLEENPLVCTERVHVVQNAVGVYLPNSADVVCGGSPKITEASPNDAPSFVQASSRTPTHITQSGTNSTSRSGSEGAAGAGTGDSENANPVFRPLATASPNLFSPPRVIIQPITTNGGANNNNLLQGGQPQPHLEIVQNNLPPGEAGEVRVSSSPVLPQLATFPNLNPRTLLNIPHFPADKTPFPHFPRNPNEGTGIGTGIGGAGSGAAAGSGSGGTGEGFWNQGNTDFFWTTAPRSTTPVPEKAEPYTIPFLTQSHMVGPAYAIGPAFTLPGNFQPLTPVQVPGDSETLPPSIIVATIPAWTAPPKQGMDTVNPFPLLNTEPVKYIEVNKKPDNRTAPIDDSGRISFTAFPPQVKTVPPKKTSEDVGASGNQDAAIGADLSTNGDQASAAKTSATTTIAVCLTVVVVVMVAVFITLCVVRHRSNSKKSISSASRTSAYVAAQATRMAYAPSAYGTGAYIREQPPRPPRAGAQAPGKAVGVQQAHNTQTWIYAPGTYASTSQYYK